MTLGAHRHIPIVVATLLASACAASAQSACQRYRAELASLGGDSGDAAAAQRQRSEIARLTGYYQSIGCDRGFTFWGPPPPAECGAIAARIRSMQATYGELASRAGAYDGSEARGAQLRSIIEEVCRKEDALRRQREAERRRERELANAAEDEEDEAPRRLGGSRIVCVRACDGFFFPLESRPGGRATENDLCQALCPGAETSAFRMPSGDADIKEAVSLRGKPYVRLANAFKYQTKLDPSCACKKPDESWAQVLQKAERMIERRPGDVMVTAQKAEELSRPKATRAAMRGKGKKQRPDQTAPENVASRKPDPGASEAKPADNASEAKAAPRRPGTLDVTTTGSTTKRNIRVVAPNVTGAPRAKSP